MLHIGLDISKKVIDVQIMHDVNNFEHLQIVNGELGYKQLIGRINTLDRKDIKVCCEYTGIYYIGIAQALYDADIAISVVNPYQIKQFAKMMMAKTKTDRQDAKLIACYSAYNNPPSWRPLPLDMQTCKAINGRIEQLMKMLTMEKNRHYVTDEIGKQSIARMIEYLQDEIERCKKKLHEVITSNDEVRNIYELVQTVPGFGAQTAAALLPLLFEVERFPTHKHFVSYLGLSPITIESGTSVRGHRRISKMGNSYLRKSLYMPARSLCLRSRLWRDWFKEKVESGKHPKQLYVVMMRKMAIYAYKVIKEKQPFDELMHKSSCD